MATSGERAKHRRWADVVVIVASLYNILSAGWAPLELLSGGHGREVGESQGLWWSYAVGGILGLGALAFSRRAPGLAKGSWGPMPSPEDEEKSRGPNRLG